MKVPIRLYYKYDLDLIGLWMNKSFHMTRVLRDIIYAEARGYEIHPEFPPFTPPKRIIFPSYLIHVEINDSDRDVIEYIKDTQFRQRSSRLKNLLRSYIPRGAGTNEIYSSRVELKLAGNHVSRKRGPVTLFADERDSRKMQREKANSIPEPVLKQKNRSRKPFAVVVDSSDHAVNSSDQEKRKTALSKNEFISGKESVNSSSDILEIPASQAADYSSIDSQGIVNTDIDNIPVEDGFESNNDDAFQADVPFLSFFGKTLL